jgi:hypothetical protein
VLPVIVSVLAIAHRLARALSEGIYGHLAPPVIRLDTDDVLTHFHRGVIEVMLKAGRFPRRLTA